MNILFNLSTLKAGGGQNVGLNFITGLPEIEKGDNRFYFLVVKNSEIHKKLISLKFNNIILTYKSPVKRIIAEILYNRNIVFKYKIDLVYTYFGYGIFPSKVKQVCGVAVSNIFFPEINFWSEYKGISLLKRKIIDKYRLWGIKKADGLIFENKMMQNRAVQLFKLSKEKTVFIKPSVFGLSNVTNKISNNSKKLKILVLCGWQLNKNIFSLPLIAKELSKYLVNFEIVFTAPKNNSRHHKQFVKQLKKYNVEKFFDLTGTVTKENIPELYNSIHFVLLMSKLESFSNNIIEAWFYKKPLIISDGDWSRSICDKAALYIKRDSVTAISQAIYDLYLDKKKQSFLVKEGLKELSHYPSVTEKTLQELNFIKQIYES